MTIGFTRYINGDLQIPALYLFIRDKNEWLFCDRKQSVDKFYYLLTVNLINRLF